MSTEARAKTATRLHSSAEHALGFVSSSGDQLATQHRNSLPAKKYAIARSANPHHAAARRGLESYQLGLAQALAPVGPQAAVGRAGHRVFINAGSRRKEARNEIEFRRIRPRCDDDAPHRQFAERRVIRLDSTQRRGGIDLDEGIELATFHVDRLLGLSGKIHLDPVA